MSTRGRGLSTGFRLGDWNALCDQCQSKFWASELRKDWRGFMLCKSCYQPRNEQDFLKGHRDDPQVAWTRPDSVNPVVTVVEDESVIVASDDLDIIDMSSQTSTRIVFLVVEGRSIGDIVTVYKTSDSYTMWVMSSAYTGTSTSVSSNKLVDLSADFTADTADNAIVNFTVNPLINAIYSIDSATQLDFGASDIFPTIGDVYVSRKSAPIRSSTIQSVAKYQLKSSGWNEISYTPSGL